MVKGPTQDWGVGKSSHEGKLLLQIDQNEGRRAIFLRREFGRNASRWKKPQALWVGPFRKLRTKEKRRGEHVSGGRKRRGARSRRRVGEIRRSLNPGWRKKRGVKEIRQIRQEKKQRPTKGRLKKKQGLSH